MSGFGSTKAQAPGQEVGSAYTFEPTRPYKEEKCYVTHHCLVLSVSGLNYKITGYHGFKNRKWFLYSQDTHKILDLNFLLISWSHL